MIGGITVGLRAGRRVCLGIPGVSGDIGHAVGVITEWERPWPGKALTGHGGADPDDPRYHEPGYGYEVRNLLSKTADGRWYWEKAGGLRFESDETRPLLAKVILRKIPQPSGNLLSSNYRIGSKSSLLIAVNPQIRVKDARATEGRDANMNFTVVLAPRALETVTVDYATSSGTATSGTDFTPRTAR